MMANDIMYLEIFRKSSEGIFICQDARIKLFNLKIEELTGYSGEELNDKLFFDFVHSADLDAVRDEFTSRLNTNGPTHPFHFRIINKKNIVKWVEINPVLFQWNGKDALLSYFIDIDRFKYIEDSQMQSQERYRDVLNAIDEGYYETDLKGNHTFVNEALCKMLGYTKEKMLRSNYKDLYSSDTVKTITNLFGNIYKTGKGMEVIDWTPENPMRDYKRRLEGSASLMTDASGKKIGFRGTLRDTTHRRNMEDALKSSEEEYRHLIENASDLIYRIDQNGIIKFLNSAVEKKTGHKKEDLIGKNYLQVIHPNHRQELGKIFRDLRDKNIDEAMYQEFRILKSDGTEMWVGHNVKNIRNSQGQLEYYAFARDITELKKVQQALEESEKKYRELVEEKSKDVIFTLDSEGRFVTANKNLKEKLGYTEEYVKGKMITEILYDDYNGSEKMNCTVFLGHLEKVLVDKMSNVRFKAICCHKHLGEPVVMQFKLDPILENGKITGILGYISELFNDPLIDYLVNVNVSYQIDNKFITAEDVSHRLTRDLEKHMDYEKISRLRLGLREMIINAIEHGNLEISYEDKTNALISEQFKELLSKRQSDLKNKNKRVSIDYSLNNERVLYTIRDEGTGFNYRDMLRQDPDKVNGLYASHGRGIMLARGLFDVLEYNEAGNEVNLIKYFKKEYDN